MNIDKEWHENVGWVQTIYNRADTVAVELMDVDVEALLDYSAMADPDPPPMKLTASDRTWTVTRWGGGVALWALSPELKQEVLLCDIRSLEVIY